MHLVEYGSDVDRGLDEAISRWAGAGGKTTYHFLDVNLEDPADLDDAWIRRTRENACAIGAAWLCGDAGLWHFGSRERGHQLLLPPILTRDSAYAIAESIGRLQEQSGLAVLPENPPGSFYLGDLHILDYFAQVSDRADCGLLLDCAHLAMFQRLRGLSPLDGFDGYPFDRVIELHIAGGTEIQIEGFPLVEDAHGPEPLPDTWTIFEHVLARAPNLRAVIYECEKNRPEQVRENFQRLNAAFPVQK